MYEPDSYLPLSRLDADGESTEQGGLGTTQDAQQPQTSKIIAASAGQTSATGQKHPNYSQQPANDTLEASYWQALNPKGTGQSTGTDGPSANANLCEVYYFHTDQVGLPEELSNAQDQIIWQAQYKTWGSTVEERWEARRLHGAKVQGQTEGDIPQGDRQEQNLRFQGQYLDRETGLHYNTFRYYDADIGRFISPDPIGLEGGINLGSYSPNPIGWIDPWGWSCRLNNLGRTPGKNSTTGRAVIAQMRSEGRIRGSGANMQFKSSTDGKWYSVKDADMAHKTDAVKYWNQRGGFHGAKSKEVRGWMRDPKNYELEYYGHNRSQGARLPDRYKDPGDFIGPMEAPRY